MKKFLKSLSAKIILITVLLIILILGVQTIIYVRVEAKKLESVLVENKSDFAQLLSINFGAAQSVGGFAFQSQLIEDASRTNDTVYVRFVKPDGEIYLSNIMSERGQILKNFTPSRGEAIIKDDVYNGKSIKIVIAPGSGGYETWLAFSLDSINDTINSAVISRIILSIFILLVGIGLAFFSTFSLTKDLRLLKDLAEEVSRGNLDVSVDIKSGDEIGNLADSFNQMIARLNDSRKSLEEKMKELSIEHGKIASLVESVRLGVVMVDLSLNVILANPAAKRILGKSPLENLTFKNLSEKIRGNIDISQALSFYVKNGKSLNVQEAMIGERYFRFFMSPVRDIVDKIFIGAVVIIEDITEEKRLDQMRTEIISITSHQLRTPSTIIKGNLEMVLGGDIGKITPEQKDVLSDVYLGNERMIRLINDLMDAAKIEEGKFKLPTEPAKLEDLVAEIVKEVSPLARSKKVMLIYDKTSKELPGVSINVVRVKQVLQNLIVNAIQYSAVDDKGVVEVDVKKEDKFLVFSVKDNGVGIPKTEQDKLFERFFRGSNVSRLDPGGGSGLGLYIARAVVEQGGGAINFVSEENKGTTFKATFPC